MEIFIKNKEGKYLYPKTKAELVEGLQSVAISGSYKDLKDKPNSGISYEDLNEEVTINPIPIREEWETFRDSINTLISDYQTQIDTLQAELDEVKSVRYVVEKWQDGANWYTIYSDGWCEQGGVTTAWYRGTTNVITFYKTYKTKPMFICNLEVTNGEANEMRVVIGNTSNNSGVNFVTTSQATVYIHGISGSGTDGGPVHWEAKGYIS